MEPSAPSAGPPVHWPTASAWFVIDSTVARIRESSIDRLSQTLKTGPEMFRATKIA